MHGVGALGAFQRKAEMARPQHLSQVEVSQFFIVK